MVPPSPLIAALERLAASEGVSQVAEALGDWRDLGLADAVAVWVHDPERDALSLLHCRGIGSSLADWRPGARTVDSPLWRAVIRAEPVNLLVNTVPLALGAALRETELDHWCTYPLRSADGQEQGVVLVGWSQSGPRELPIQAAGVALARAVASDRNRWKAAWFDHIQGLTTDGIIVATPDGDVHTYNAALERMTGWSLSDVRSKGWTNLVYQDDRVRADVQRGIAALMLGQPSAGVVRPLATKAGGEVQVRIWSAVAPHPSSGAPALVGLFQDVTRERSDARAITRQDALSKLGRMAGGVAHEFNNLLGAIMGHAELIELHPDIPDDIRARAATIVMATQRGAHLSGQLLVFSGATMASPMPSSPQTLVRELVDLYRPAVPNAVQVTLTLDDDLPAIEADEALLQQAITNIMANARDAAHGSIRVDVRAMPLPDDVRYRAAGAPPSGTRMCRIRVSDDGPGFGREALTNLFEPFFTSKSRGHGLGLAAVRGILGLHDGAVDVTHEVGTSVDLYLPFSVRPELKLPRLAADRVGRGGRVWLVDDETALLEFGRISLEAEGYQVRAFSEGRAAVAAVDDLPTEELPDVIVVDVVMPELNGPQVVAALRGQGLAARLLWTSGYSPETAKVPPGVGAFLQKPFTGRDLAKAVAAAMESDA